MIILKNVMLRPEVLLMVRNDDDWEESVVQTWGPRPLESLAPRRPLSETLPACLKKYLVDDDGEDNDDDEDVYDDDVVQMMMIMMVIMTYSEQKSSIGLLFQNWELARSLPEDIREKPISNPFHIITMWRFNRNGLTISLTIINGVFHA